MKTRKAIMSDDRGAVDLQSTMVTALILAALSGAITLSVFKVVPWVQDVVTQSSLSAVAEAQKIQHIMGGSYVNEATLVASGLITQKDADRVDTRALEKPWDGRIRAGVPAGEHFIVSMVSATGKNLFMHDGSGSSISEMPAQSTGLMASTWDTSIAPNCREISLPVGDFTGTVNWGDGTTNDQTSHLYSDSAGSTQIAIDGYFTSWGGEAWEDANCLISVDSWGETGTNGLEYGFSNADNLRHVEAIPSTITNMRHSFSYIDSAFTLGALDTSNVTNMNNTFFGANKFNQPLTLNTSKVENMNGTFRDAIAFNSPLTFDTSNVTTMSNMFRGATAFNQPVDFATLNVNNMYAMFYEASSYDQSVNFDTAQVTTMANMFWGATKFNQTVPFATSKVTDMYAMFYNATAFDQPVNFDTASVESMASMFYGATAFNHPVSFASQQVTTVRYMFRGAESFDSPVSIDTSQVNDFSLMFFGAIIFNQPVEFVATEATTMASMFQGAKLFNQPVTVVGPKLESVNGMFRDTLKFDSPVNLHSATVKDFARMFYGAKAFNQPLNFETSEATDMTIMFYGASMFNQDLSAWAVSKVTSANRTQFDVGATSWVKPRPSWSD